MDLSDSQTPSPVRGPITSFNTQTKPLLPTWRRGATTERRRPLVSELLRERDVPRVRACAWGRFLHGDIWNTERDIFHVESDHCGQVPWHQTLLRTVRPPVHDRVHEPWPFRELPGVEPPEVFNCVDSAAGSSCHSSRFPERKWGRGALTLTTAQKGCHGATGPMYRQAAASVSQPGPRTRRHAETL